MGKDTPGGKFEWQCMAHVLVQMNDKAKDPDLFYNLFLPILPIFPHPLHDVDEMGDVGGHKNGQHSKRHSHQ